MKLGPFAPMPWDMVVFLTITTVGFGFSVQRVMHPDRSTRLALALDQSPQSQQDKSDAVGANASPSQTLDLGCLEEKKNHDRITSQDGAIRLKGELCHLNTKRMRTFDGMTVKNLTTGYEGTIFFRGYSNAFVTDFLVLTNGRNLIQVEWRESATATAQLLTAEVFEK